MRRDLLRTSSFEYSLQEVEVREDQGVLVTVIRMDVSLFHVLEVLLVVALAVFSLVLGFQAMQILLMSGTYVALVWPD